MPEVSIMNLTQNDRLKQVTSDTLIVGVDVGSQAANELVLKQGVDDIRPNTFFFTMPEEIESVAERHGLTKIKNIGTDYFVTMSVVDKMDDEKFALYMELAEEMAKYESCTGMSNHALLVCQKNFLLYCPKCKKETLISVK